MAGEAIAGELGLAVARIQLATVVSSYLGETARNLEQIFAFLNAGSWVLQFDEFDMLGRERSDRRTGRRRGRRRQRRPMASPRRMPVVASTTHSAWRRSPDSRDCSRNERSVAASQAWTPSDFWPALGGSAASAGLRASRPQCTASRNARWRIVWTSSPSGDRARPRRVANEAGWPGAGEARPTCPS